eukprot:1160036-Pyramimonas_sp.AAC.1
MLKPKPHGQAIAPVLPVHWQPLRLEVRLHPVLVDRQLAPLLGAQLQADVIVDVQQQHQLHLLERRGRAPACDLRRVDVRQALQGVRQATARQEHRPAGPHHRRHGSKSNFAL